MRLRQPYLHDKITAVLAPGVALSAADGQIREGVDGVYWADRRLLSRFLVRVDGTEPVAIGATATRGDRVRFAGVLRELGDLGADPTVFLDRTRTLVPGGVVESVTVTSHARGLVQGTLEIEAACDLEELAVVKSGGGGAGLQPSATTPDGFEWRDGDGAAVCLRAAPAPDSTDSTGRARWSFALGPGERFELSVTAEFVHDPRPVAVLAARGSEPTLQVSSGDHRLSALIEQSLADLRVLALADPLAPADRFLAAGAPWYLTLFGRDAIWAARMLLPVDLDIAAGTLRALARRQGHRVDAVTAEQPGKMMHELRPAETGHGGPGAPMRLPPLYYGTVDATALWVSLLHDAWRWGLPAEQVVDLLPAADLAMGWITGHGTDEVGFVSYRDQTGHGLANQGWKDSGDSVQFRDGTLARPPIALCEVQGYAYAAARQAADLFEAFGRDGGDRWRNWAAGLAARFRAAFWVDDPEGAYPAIALEAGGRRVDSATSNIGHLLGTGLLNADEERLVVDRLGRADLAGAFGLRTMSSTSVGFNPLAYHGGTVWTHDTAIAISGLLVSAAPAAPGVAAELISGLLGAAPAFGYRLPELFGGHARDDSPAPVAYPAACRPQAWSATASLAMLRALLGLDVDVPGGVIRLAPLRPSPVGELDVRGLRVGPHCLDVRVDADGGLSVEAAPSGLRVVSS